MYGFIGPREPLITYTITFLQEWVDVNPDCENGDKPSFSHVTIYTVDLMCSDKVTIFNIVRFFTFV